MKPRSLLQIVTDDVSAPLLRGQLSFLSASGFSVVVACGTTHGGLPIGFDDEARVERLPLVREPAPLRDLQALIATIQLLRRLRPDIVNVSTPKASLIGMLASRVCRIPIRVLVVRGFRFETTTGFRWWYLRTLERFAASLATQVLVNSPSLMEFGIQERVLNPSNTEVLGNGSGNGVDLSRFSVRPKQSEARTLLGLHGDRPTIGFVGRLTSDKGIDDLIQIFIRVRERIDGTQLLLVGPLEDGDPISGWTRERIETDPNIVHIPYLENPTAAFSAMDVFVFPSYREGLPNVVLEAQICHTPVVAYEATGTIDALRENVGGVLVPVGDLNFMANEIELLLLDPVRRIELASRGADWVRSNFNQERHWADLLRRYQQWLADIGR